MILGRELEDVGDQIYPPKDLEGPHKLWTELTTGQMQFGIPVGEPEAIPYLEVGDILAAMISLMFLFVDDPVDLVVGGFPRLVHLPEPIIKFWDICLVRISWAMGRLVTEDTLEQGESSRGVPERIIGMLSPWQETGSVVLVVVAVSEKKPPQVLVSLRHLSILSPIIWARFHFINSKGGHTCILKEAPIYLPSPLRDGKGDAY